MPRLHSCCLPFQSEGQIAITSMLLSIGVRGGGGGGGLGGAAAPWNFQNSHIRAKISGNIRAKPLDFRASNGENIRATDLSPPKRNWSRTPMLLSTQWDAVRWKNSRCFKPACGGKSSTFWNDNCLTKIALESKRLIHTWCQITWKRIFYPIQ